MLFSGLLLFSIPFAFADQPINSRVEIDNDDLPSDVVADDLFGYQVAKLNDLDGDGVTDLAVTKFSDDSAEADVGSILIMFMNSDGSVKSTNEITQDGTAGNIDSDCIAPDSTNRETTTLEQLAFVGDLDGDGEPTLAVGAADNEYPLTANDNTGAIYMLELNTNGTVDNCFLIIPNNATHTSGFAPGNGVYREGSGAFLGWPLIATDLNGDGQNELIAGATNEGDDSTNLWPLFLNSTGGVASHPATPIFGIADIGIDSGDFVDDGDTVNGDNKIVLGVARAGTSNNGGIFVVNIDSSGAFTSATETTGVSLGVIDDAGDRFGSGVSNVDDMDGDGVEDILVGNISGDDVNSGSGEVFLLFMNSNDGVKGNQTISNLTPVGGSTSTFLASGDQLGHGIDLWRDDNNNNALIVIGAHSDDTGGGDAGAVHIFSISRISETFTSEETTDASFTVELNDIAVSVSDSGGGTKSISVNQLTENPESVAFPVSSVGTFYDLDGSGNLNNITIKIEYTDAEITGLDESTLTIYRFTGGKWIALTTTVDEQNNTATAVTPGFSTFSLGGNSLSSGSGGHGKQLNRNCTNDLGDGQSLDVLYIFVTEEIGPLRAVSVDLVTTCGPASVRISNDYGMKIAGLSFYQSDHSDKNPNSKLTYVSEIESDSKKVTIVAKDKRDVFVETIHLTKDRFEKYYNSTGYTSKQHSSIEYLKNESTTPVDKITLYETVPPNLKNQLSQWTGHPSRDHYFFDSVQNLIDHGYIEYADWQKSISLQESRTYPDWVHESVSFYINGSISDDEFLEMIKYLIENRTIRIGR